MRELVLISLGGRRYGVWKEDVLSVRDTGVVHVIPMSPERFAGITEIDGRTGNLFDLGVCVGQGPLDRKRQGRALIMSERGKPEGFVFDSEDGRLEVAPEDVLPLPDCLLSPAITSCVRDAGEPVPVIDIRLLYKRVREKNWEAPAFQFPDVKPRRPKAFDGEFRTFTVGGETFAVPGEVVEPRAVEPGTIRGLASAPPYLEGVAFHGGRALAVLNLAEYLGLSGTPQQGNMLVARDGAVAFLIDSDLGKFKSEEVPVTMPLISSSDFMRHALLRKGEVVPLLNVHALVSRKPGGIFAKKYTPRSRFHTLFGRKEVKVLEFSLPGVRHSMPDSQVGGVVPSKPFRSMPGVHPMMAGLAEHEGEVLPVLDLAVCFGRRTATAAGPDMLLLKNGNFRALLLTEEVTGKRILTVEEQRALPIQLQHMYVYGCYPDDITVKLILNVETLTTHFDEKLVGEYFEMVSREVEPSESPSHKSGAAMGVVAVPVQEGFREEAEDGAYEEEPAPVFEEALATAGSNEAGMQGASEESSSFQGETGAEEEGPEPVAAFGRVEDEDGGGHEKEESAGTVVMPGGTDSVEGVVDGREGISPDLTVGDDTVADGSTGFADSPAEQDSSHEDTEELEAGAEEEEPESVAAFGRGGDEDGDGHEKGESSGTVVMPGGTDSVEGAVDGREGISPDLTVGDDTVADGSTGFADSPAEQDSSHEDTGELEAGAEEEEPEPVAAFGGGEDEDGDGHEKEEYAGTVVMPGGTDSVEGAVDGREGISPDLTVGDDTAADGSTGFADSPDEPGSSQEDEDKEDLETGAVEEVPEPVAAFGGVEDEDGDGHEKEEYAGTVVMPGGTDSVEGAVDGREGISPDLTADNDTVTDGSMGFGGSLDEPGPSHEDSEQTGSQTEAPPPSEEYLRASSARKEKNVVIYAAAVLLLAVAILLFVLFRGEKADRAGEQVASLADVDEAREESVLPEEDMVLPEEEIVSEETEERTIPPEDLVPTAEDMASEGREVETMPPEEDMVPPEEDIVSEEQEEETVPPKTEPVSEPEKVSARVEEVWQDGEKRSAILMELEPEKSEIAMRVIDTIPSGARVHVVVKGDTLWDIARRFTGNPFNYPRIAEDSQIRNPDLIFPGQKVVVRIKGSQTPEEPPLLP